MKKLFLFVIVFIGLTQLSSCSDDDSVSKNVTLQDLGIEYGAEYEVQSYVKIDKDKWGYVDFSPKVYITFIDENFVREKNENGAFMNQYSLIPTKLSSYPNPNLKVETKLNFIKYAPNAVKTYVINPRENCKLIRDSGRLILKKPIDNNTNDFFRLVR
ncbi:hypothetical protein [uncultured Apibacter sp.]|uniref:hypothetical protein n=1 Tax=uncultured Apibacter sp. TaxID=1778616 RepID=UPI0025D06810|nr:hypothetical protein [uncultured Apibacter sp.]